MKKNTERELYRIAGEFILCLFIFGLFLNFISVSATTFTITKQECHNEIQKQFRCSDGTFYIDTIGAFENIKFFSTKDGKECIDNSIEVERCEQVEVDKIESFNYCIVGEEINEKNCVYSFKRQKDLTTEWLEENCECNSLCSPDYEGYSACKRGICVEYKCGESYFVEVK